jgi:hypothetical protein
MLLIIALIIAVIFLGLGFAIHLLWLGLIIAAIVAVFHFITGTGSRGRNRV